MLARGRRSVIVVGLLGLTLRGLACLVAGCGESLPPAPPWERVMEAFGAKPNPAAIQPSTDATPEALTLNIWIDGSKSMRGFVRMENTSFVRVMRWIMEKSATAEFLRRTSRFWGDENGELRIAQVDAARVQDLLSPWFYEGKETPLSSLLDRVARESSPHKVFIIVSDLVQSEREKDQLALAQSFRKVGERGGEILLLAFRSGFDGEYFIETSPGGSPIHLLLVESAPARGRPFYLLVVAPSAEALSQLERYVLDGTAADQSFRPTRPPLVVTDAVQELGQDESTWLWGREDKENLTHGLDQAARVLASYLYRGSSGLPIAPLTVRYKARPDLPVVTPAGLRVDIEETRFSLGTCRGSASASSARSTVSGNIDASEFAVVYDFPPPSLGEWSAYRVRLSAGPGNLAVPVWVRDWSTDDDRSPRFGERTLHLNILVEAMVRGTTEDVVVVDHYFLLGRNN